MISYDSKSLNEIFDSLATLLNANVSLYDEYFEGLSIANFGNKSKICTSLKQFIRESCNKSDSYAIKKCAETNQPFSYACHLGFTEIIIPFSINRVSSFYVIVGPFKQNDKIEEIEKRLTDRSTEYGLDITNLKANLKNMADLNDSKYASIIKIIQTIIENAINKKQIFIKDNFVENKLNPYIDENLSKQITVNEICKKFFYSSKQLELIVKEYAGISTKKYILKYKINKSKNLLINTSKNLQEVAYEIGFLDYNYFIKVFKSITGETPLHYRKKFSINALLIEVSK